MVLSVLPDPNPEEDDAKFFGFSKKAEDGPSQTGRLSKPFPEVPIVFRGSCGNPESHQSFVVVLGIVKILSQRSRNSPFLCKS